MRDEVSVTCCCGAKWYGPSTYGNERAKFAEDHQACREAFAESLKKGHPIPSSEEVMDRARAAEQAKQQVRREEEDRRKEEKEGESMRSMRPD